MVRFWFRELVGWLLLLLGLGVFYLAAALMLSPPPGPEAIFEGPALIVIGIVIFRGGIHLLKVSLAARVCLAAQSEAQKPKVAEKRARQADTPWDW